MNEEERAILKMELYRLVRNCQDLPKKTIVNEIKRAFPDVDWEVISEILLEFAD